MWFAAGSRFIRNPRPDWATAMDPTSTKECLAAELNASIAAKRTLLADQPQLDAFARVVKVITATYRRRGRLYVAGNGGSSCDAQHLAAEFVCKLGRARAPLAAEALTADMAALTAISNDYAFEHIFARQLQCKATPNDVFLALTTSGNSQNIINALEMCREVGVFSILFSGRGGGIAAPLADICIVAPGENSCRVQELHIVLYHALVACVEDALFFNIGDEQSECLEPSARSVVPGM
jgi:D-sedoheptulose 7-phosphate isomerase